MSNNSSNKYRPQPPEKAGIFPRRGGKGCRTAKMASAPPAKFPCRCVSLNIRPRLQRKAHEKSTFSLHPGRGRISCIFMGKSRKRRRIYRRSTVRDGPPRIMFNTEAHLNRASHIKCIVNHPPCEVKSRRRAPPRRPHAALFRVRMHCTRHREATANTVPSINGMR